jgi:CheY-like chemotaxis protein
MLTTEGRRIMIILIAEDDDGHAELIEEGLRESGVCNQIIRFANGETLWHFLTGEGTQNGKKNWGYLLLLDFNMPKMDGVEVLRRMKSNEE